MSGLLGLPVTWELDPLNLSIPESNRDFTLNSRIDKSISSSIPTDLSFINDEQKDKELLQQEILIKNFQRFFGQSQPIIGQIYFGPIDGKINQNLIQAALNAESVISNSINEPKVNGMIWNSSKRIFNTSPDDVSMALKMIQQNLSNKENKQIKSAIRTFYYSTINN